MKNKNGKVVQTHIRLKRTYIEDLSIIKNRNQKARAKTGIGNYRGRTDNYVSGEEMSPEFSQL